MVLSRFAWEALGALFVLLALLAVLNSEFSAPDPYVISKVRKSTEVRLWFFAPDCERPHMEFMVKQAVLSALHYTKLFPIAMLNCKNADLEKWFADHNVTVVDPSMNNLVQFLEAQPRKVPRLGTKAWYGIAIPDVIEELIASRNPHINSLVQQNPALLQYVLYTHVDVVFINNVAFQEHMLPRYIALPIQSDAWCCKNDPYEDEMKSNNGMFLMNVTSFKEAQGEFMKHIETRLMQNKDNDPTDGRFHDETAFHEFFPVRRTHVPWYEKIHMRLFYFLYYQSLYTKYYSDVLPKEYEWEPYLGVNPNAVLLHWHGPKPFLQSCSQLHPHYHAAHNSTHEHTRHYSRAALAATNITALPMETSGPGRSMFADKYNRVIKQLLLHNLTVPYVPRSQLRAEASVFPPSYDWYTPMKLTSEDRAQVVASAEQDFHYLQTLTEGSLQGYHYGASLFFSYMNLICSEHTVSR